MFSQITTQAVAAKKRPTATMMTRFTFVVRRPKSTSGTPVLSLSIAIGETDFKGAGEFHTN